MRTPPADAATPRGAKPFVVFLAPAQFEALVLQAEDEGVGPDAVVRHSLRRYLHDVAVIEFDAEAER